MPDAVIEARGLTKRYGDLMAVSDLNLEIREGEVFGLLGPNGAGKTTTILMLLGLTEPTAGTARVAGFDPTRQPLEVKRVTGYLPDNVGFYDDMTGRQNLLYTAALNGLPRGEAESRIERLLERVGLTEAADRRVGTYSRGMRQRLGLADVLLKEPRVVVLDEPTLGLDPKGAQEFLVLIRTLAKEERRTVLLSSHLLHQVQQICDRVGIFVRGRMLAAGPIDELADRLLGHEPLLVEMELQPAPTGAVEAVRAVAGVEAVQEDGRLLLVRAGRDVRADLVRAATAAGAGVVHLRLRGRTLDDIYRRYFQADGGEYGHDDARSPLGAARP